MKLFAPLLSLIVLFGFVDSARSEALDFSALRSLAIQDRGRIKPLDTYARETLRAITGKETGRVLGTSDESLFPNPNEPVAVLFSMLFRWDDWSRKPAIRIRSVVLRTELGTPDRYVSFQSLTDHGSFRTSLRAAFAQRERGVELTERDKALLDLFQQVELFRSLSKPAERLAVICPKDAICGEETTWMTIAQEMENNDDDAAWIADSLDELQGAFLEGDAEGFAAASSRFVSHLERGQSFIRHPSLEIHYNRLKPFRVASYLFLMATALWFVAIAVNSKFGDAFAWSVSGLGIAVHTWGFVLRVLISGRAPVTNMYESLVFMAYGIVLVSFVFEALSKLRLVMLSGSLTGGMLLIMAHVLPIDSSIAVILPVLRSNFWLVVHVLVIMLSYSAFAQAWALGHVILIRLMVRPKEVDCLKPVFTFLYRTLQVGVLLLAAGIILGAMWANVSWGRYWGWDPKETWSLICLFGYLALLHARYTNWVGQFGLALGSIVAFMLVVMCYYGVNFVLRQGLHSYGSGSGGIQYAVAYIMIDAMFILAVFVRRQTARESGSTV